jgi:intracellular multiplication protein IcmP
MAEGGDSNDGLWMMFFILLIVGALFYGIWFLFKPQVLQGYLWVRQGEIAVGSLWTDNDYAVDVVIAGEKTTMTFGEAHELIDSLTPQILLNDDVKTWEIITATSTAVLKPFRIPFGIGFLVLIYLTLFKGPTTHFRRTYGLDSLIDTQSNTFKVIKPFVSFNPLTDVPPRAPGAPVPAELPLFAEALGPEEWLAFHKIPMPDGQLDNDSCERAFEIHLGQ